MDIRTRIFFISRTSFTLGLLAFLAVGAFGAELTEPERLYVNQAGTVHFCVDPDWAPFEGIDDTGHHVGIAADLLALVAKNTGLNLRLLPTRDWPESIEAAKAGRCQMMSLLNQTPARDEWLIFTQPILTDANVVITREEHPFIVDLKGVSGKTMVLPKGTSIEERVRRDFPNINIVIVETEAEAFQRVSDRRADITLRSLIVAAHTIKHEGWFNLKIAGQVPAYANQLRIGVIKGDPVLRDILNKGVASINAAQRQQIIDAHVAIKVTTGIDYRPAALLAAVFAVIWLISLYWLRKLNRLNTALKANEVALQQSQRIAGLGSYVLDAPTGAWTSSVVFDELFGTNPAYNRSAAGWAALVHPDDRAAMVDYFNEAVANQSPDFDQYYRIIRHNDQAERWVHALGQLAFDRQGKLQKVFGTVQDITEQ
jgi:PAS domain S-box-containing protein